MPLFKILRFFILFAAIAFICWLAESTQAASTGQLLILRNPGASTTWFQSCDITLHNCADIAAMPQEEGRVQEFAFANATNIFLYSRQAGLEDSAIATHVFDRNMRLVAQGNVIGISLQGLYGNLFALSTEDSLSLIEISWQRRRLSFEVLHKSLKVYRPRIHLFASGSVCLFEETRSENVQNLSPLFQVVTPRCFNQFGTRLRARPVDRPLPPLTVEYRQYLAIDRATGYVMDLKGQVYFASSTTTSFLGKLPTSFPGFRRFPGAPWAQSVIIGSGEQIVFRARGICAWKQATIPAELDLEMVPVLYIPPTYYQNWGNCGRAN